MSLIGGNGRWRHVEALLADLRSGPPAWNGPSPSSRYDRPQEQASSCGQLQTEETRPSGQAELSRPGLTANVVGDHTPHSDHAVVTEVNPDRTAAFAPT